MKKTDKKIENTLVKSLTEVCDTALKDIAGFEWITHVVNFSHFPKSLVIICVFDTNESMANVISCQKDETLRQLIKEKLGSVNIHLNDINEHVVFDTEEACQAENRGKWQERLR